MFDTAIGDGSSWGGGLAMPAAVGAERHQHASAALGIAALAQLGEPEPGHLTSAGVDADADVGRSDGDGAAPFVETVEAAPVDGLGKAVQVEHIRLTLG